MLKHQIIKNRYDQTLFEGKFHSFQEAVETALQDNINLAYANFKQKNLQNITLDDAALPHADFTEANLTGANLSEADLTHAYFDNADLYNTCLAYSDLSACSFNGSHFGGTDITGALLCRTRFSGLSCFDLDFINAGTIENCIYINPDETIKIFSCPPIVIKGYDKPLVMLDDDPVQALTNSPFFIHLMQQQIQNNSSLVE